MSQQGSYFLTVDEWLEIFSLGVATLKTVIIQGKITHDAHVSEEVEEEHKKLMRKWTDEVQTKRDFHDNVYKQQLPDEEIPPLPPRLTVWEKVAKKMMIQIMLISKIVPLNSLSLEEKKKLIVFLNEVVTDFELEEKTSKEEEEKRQQDKPSLSFLSFVYKMTLLGFVILITETIIKDVEAS